MLDTTPAVRRTLVRAAISTLAVTALVAPGTAATGAEKERPADAVPAPPPGTLTDFGFDAASYGSMTTGNPNAQSGATGLSHLPCTRYVPRSNDNFVAEGGDGDGVSVQGVTTRNFTEQRGGATAAVSVVHIASGTLADGQLAFTDLTGRVRSFHDSTGFHVQTVSDLGSLSLGGTPVDLPTGGEEAEIVVPGAGTLFLNRVQRAVTPRSATGGANVMRFEGEDGTTQKIGRAFSRIDGEIEGGLFSGSAWGSDGRVNGAAGLGKAALQPMPCPGTRGAVLTNSTGRASHEFGSLGARQSSVYGVQRDDRSATGYTHSHVDSAGFAGGRLQFRNVNAFANVTRRADGVVARDSDGTGIGRIVVNGETVLAPQPGEPRGVPGVGSFTVRSVDRSPTGIDVTAVVVRLSNGTADTSDDTVVNLGRARLAVKRG